jgi:hypothetical protein
MIPKTGNKQADNILIFAIVAAVVYLVYKITKVAGGVASAGETVIDTVNDWLEGDTDQYNPENLGVDYTKTNYPESQFKIWADVIEDSIDFFSPFGNDEQPIKDIMFSINNDEDLKAIIKAYGLRTSIIGINGGNLVSTLRQYTPELIDGFNYHYAGWNMKGRI